ncbi:UvrD-helicase domain-containing protein [candidate division WOR-3 bacterium]|nr:UvrD-helicase domain-containing protein [candidate division WOR-3 bacterium]
MKSHKGIPKKTHLDVTKSLIFSSPAGSGKTQKLAERYVALLEAGVLPQRILAITFTEKAAAEMKERVLKLLREHSPELHDQIQSNLSRFRISTVHAFAMSVLERFAFDLDLAPDLDILDAIEADLLREEVIRDGLVELGMLDNEVSLWVRHLTLTEGWTSLQIKIRSLFKHIPQSYMALNAAPQELTQVYFKSFRTLKDSWGMEFWEASGFAGLPESDNRRRHLRAVRALLDKVAPRFITQAGTLRKRLPKAELEREGFRKRAEVFQRYHEVFWQWHAAVQTEGFLSVFRHLAERYEERKHADRKLDFADLEYKLYEVLYHSDNWSNVLQSFDEQTDHILVDEFQDTNGLQWAIVSKLAEEWRAGMGAKRESGKVPTLFLVGDEKQSIYLFRGANVEVFRRAKREMKEWMGQAFEEVTLRENYRSLPRIVDFVNRLFSKLMSGGTEDWQTSYDKFRHMREPEETAGHVEVLLTRTQDKLSMEEMKAFEAQTVAQRITEIVGNLPVFDKINGKEHQRTCEFADITLLLRRRTHLDKYEEALRRQNIPFVVVQGTGFHSSPEVVLLRQLVRVLPNPRETTALYWILRSPLCGLSEEQILRIACSEEGTDFWERFRKYSASGADPGTSWLEDVFKEVDRIPSAILFEKILRERRLWSYYSTRQEAENIRKFLRIIEDFDREGLSCYEIAERLERMSTREEEPKANVNTEGMNAVRLMTIHAAKGLDSNVVFLVGMDDVSGRRPESLALREEAQQVLLTFTDSQDHPERILWKAKLAEEEKRLFYVACTRARDALFLSGVWGPSVGGWLTYLVEGFELSEVMDKIQMPVAPEGVALEVRTHREALEQVVVAELVREDLDVPKTLERNWSQRKGSLVTVSDELEASFNQTQGLRYFGEIIHAVLERISKGSLSDDREAIKQAVRVQVFSFDLAPSRVPAYQEKIIHHIDNLRTSGLLEQVILPQKNAHTEVGFRLRQGSKTITGRIDRVLVIPEGLHVIDYKSFPSEAKTPRTLKATYAPQLAVYGKAAAGLFSKPVLKRSLLFTADAKMMEF